MGLESEYTHNWHLPVVFELIVIMFCSEKVYCCLMENPAGGLKYVHTIGDSKTC